MSGYTPGGSSRLDISGADITEVTKKIGYNQTSLKWLHASAALKLAQDPYINELIRQPLKWVEQVYLSTDPDGNPVGRQWLNAIYQEQITEQDLPLIAARTFQFLELRITSLRVVEMVRYLSSADPSEKLITGSIIMAATEASEMKQKKAETIPAPAQLEEELDQFRENHPVLYNILVEDTRRQLEKIQALGSGTPQTPKTIPVVGETEREQGEEPQK